MRQILVRQSDFNDKVEIVDDDPTWPEKAKEEIESVIIALGDKNIHDIQHVGSTAIPQAKENTALGKTKNRGQPRSTGLLINFSEPTF